MGTIVTDERSYAEVTAEVLSRFSVMDLTEMDDSDISIGDKKLNKAEQLKSISIKESGTDAANLINFWVIESDGKEYHVRRFENFVWCSCPDFFYSRRKVGESAKATMCKHLTATLKRPCIHCYVREAESGFKMCRNCQIATAPFLKPQLTNYKSVKVGNIRV